MLNTASCIFAVMWALSEARFSLGDTWRTERGAPEAPAANFRMTQSTHPPAELRYLRFRDFQRDNATRYGLANGTPQLAPLTDAYSFNMVQILTRSLGYCDNLLAITPMIARTPDMDTLIAYEEHLVGVGAQLAPHG